MSPKLDALFSAGCDPYAAGAAALFGKSPDAITQDERDLVKRVFMRIAARRGGSDVEGSSQCTGTLVHDEFTACPVHDRRHT